jgi:hypothetical protein
MVTMVMATAMTPAIMNTFLSSLKDSQKMPDSYCFVSQ